MDLRISPSGRGTLALVRLLPTDIGPASHDRLRFHLLHVMAEPEEGRAFVIVWQAALAD
jgi:hypothetical protein